MAYDKEKGIVYIDTTVSPNKGIGISDIQQAVGLASGDLGKLCQWKNIRRFAKYKPFEPIVGDPETILDEDTIKSNNCGLIIDSYQSADEALTKAKNDDTWTWNYPTTRFRELDFNGYCRKCTEPFYKITTLDRWGIEERLSASTQFVLEHQSFDYSDYLVKLSDLKIFDDHIDKLVWCLVYRKSTKTTGAMVTLLDNNQQINVKNNCTLTAEFSEQTKGNTEYDCCICLYYPKEGEEKYYILDSSYRKITSCVKSAEEYSNFDFDESWYIRLGNKNTLYFQLYLINKNNSQQNVKISYYIWDTSKPDEYILQTSSTFTINANESKNIIFSDYQDDMSQDTMTSVKDESNAGGETYKYKVVYEFQDRYNVVVTREGTFTNEI